MRIFIYYLQYYFVMMANINYYKMITKMDFYEDYFSIKLKTPNGEYVNDYFDYELNELYFYNNPEYKSDAFDINLNKFYFDTFDKTLNFDIGVTYIHHEIVSTLNFLYCDFLESDLYFECWLDDEIVFESEVNFFNKRGQKNDIVFSLNENQITSKNMIKFIFYSSEGYSKIFEYKITNYWNTTFNIDFYQNDRVGYFLPIYYEDKIYYNSLYFKNLLRNNYIYPFFMKPIFIFEFDSNFDNVKNIFVNDFQVNLKYGYENTDNINLNFIHKNNCYLFYVDDFFYYDLISDKTFKGNSKVFKTKKSFIIPWNYNDNELSLELNIEITTINNQTYDVFIKHNFYIKKSITDLFSFEETEEKIDNYSYTIKSEWI